MFTREKLSRLVKKESILYGKSREKLQKELFKGLSTVLDERFLLLNNDNIQAVHLKILTEGVDNPAHFEYGKSTEIDVLYRKNIFDRFAVKFHNTGESVLVMPLNWYLLGGFICELEDLLINFNKISLFIDDDFSIFNGCFNSSAMFKGERQSEESINYSLERKGSFFGFFEMANREGIHRGTLG